MSDKKHFTEDDREERKGPHMDNPEQSKTDKESLSEMHEEEMNVDTIPLEDLKQEQQEEKNPRATKNNSSSEEKYSDS